MDLSAWAHQRARYSRAKRGRNERGATMVECALVSATAQALGLRARSWQAPEAASSATPPAASSKPAPAAA